MLMLTLITASKQKTQDAIFKWLKSFFLKKSNCSKLNVSWRDNFLNIVHILPVDDGGLRNSSSLHPHHEPTFYSVENKTSDNT